MADEWEPRMVRRPDGAKRAKSKASEGSDRELMYDRDGNLLGPPESREPDPGELERILGLGQDPPLYHSKELTPRQQAAADALSDAFLEILSALAQDVALPFLKGYVIPTVKERIADTIDTARTKAAERREQRRSRRAAGQAGDAARTSNAVAEPKPTIVMTSEQFREHVRLNVRAQQWVDQHKDMLSRVVVSDETLTPELREAVRLVLDGRSHELDADILTQLSDYFSDAEPDQGTLPAAKPKKHKPAAALPEPDSEPDATP